MASRESPAPEAALVRARKVDLRPRINGVLAHKLERVHALMEKQLLKDVKDVNMSQFAYLSDEELAEARYRGMPLTARQKRVARAWEASKKEAPLFLHAAHERLTNALRGRQEQKQLSINVERAVIRVPDTRDDRDEDAVVIDVEADVAAR